jgi:hypothetical protein
VNIQPASTVDQYVIADSYAPAPEAEPGAPDSAPASGATTAPALEAAATAPEDDSARVEVTRFAAYGANGRPITARSSAPGTISFLA